MSGECNFSLSIYPRLAPLASGARYVGLLYAFSVIMFNLCLYVSEANNANVYVFFVVLKYVFCHSFICEHGNCTALMLIYLCKSATI